jgi:hypothetical protein
MHASSSLSENVCAFEAGEGSDEVSLLKASVPLREFVSVNRQQVDLRHRRFLKATSQLKRLTPAASVGARS